MRAFFKFLNILALLVLLLSCLATYIKPTDFWQLSFIGFAFPVVLLVNFLFLVLWLFKRDAFGLLSLVAIVLTWHFIQSIFAINFKEMNKESGTKLMTWNVKNFDLYNWSHNKQTRREMMKLIEAENPDILCLQEFYTENIGIFNNTKFLTDSLGYSYHYFQPTTTIDRADTRRTSAHAKPANTIHREWGVAIFSKYNITSIGRIDFTNARSNDCIYADIDIKGKPCRVYVVHFQSIHFANKDYAALDSLRESNNPGWASIKNLLRKMKRAYTKRSQQANAVAENMNDFSGSKILCGDFNDVPVSYTYETVKQSMNDAFVEKGKGFGATYAGKFSVFRIDYTFFHKGIRINSCKTIHREFSDHYPVVTTFSL